MLAVDDPDGVLDTMDDDVHKALIDTLRHDPRPRYQHDPERVYAMPFADGVVRFRVDGERAIIVKKC